MSQYIVEESTKKFVFGWDPPLQSFYLQVHDLTREVDDQIVLWLGAGSCGNAPKMYEVEDLVLEAMKHGLEIPYRAEMDLAEDKNNER
jgi:hypothetical protein